MTARRAAAEPDPADAAAVTGELVDDTAGVTVIPDQATQNQTADRARGRTTLQVGIPTAIVNVLVWIARLRGWDLNPLPDSADIPPEIASNFVALFTVLLAFRMNPKR